MLGLTAAACFACSAPQEPAADTVAPAIANYACGERGYLATNLHGALSLAVDWSADDLSCEGMPRPGGEGARLRFAGSEGERNIAIIIGLPGLERGATGEEIASNVTLIEEGGGRFFSSADLDNCWTDITSLEAIDESDERFAIGGTLYCALPLAEVNGSASVSFSAIEFRGLLDWSAS